MLGTGIFGGGNDLSFVTHNNGEGSFDPGNAYDSDPYYANGTTQYTVYDDAGNGTALLAYGVLSDFDNDAQYQPNRILAPYCWPDATNAFGADQDMTGAKYVNVAKAMERSAVLVQAKPANTGSYIDQTMFSLYYTYTDAYGQVRYVEADTATTAAGNSRAIMINVPLKVAGIDVTEYQVKVSMSGYTAGYQTVNTFTLDSATDTGRLITLEDEPYNFVSIPYKAKGIDFVVDWNDPNVNLDMFLWLPHGVDSEQWEGPGNFIYGTPGPGAVIGTEGDALDVGGTFTTHKLVQYLGNDYDKISYGIGTLLRPDQLVQESTLPLPFSPYAQVTFDGGINSGQAPVDGAGNALLPSDNISVAYGAATKGTAKYFPKYYTTSGGIYELYVTDYSQSHGGSALYQSDGTYLIKDRGHFDYVAPVVRVWAYGVLTGTIKLEDSTASCDGTKDFWHAATMNGTNMNWNVALGTNECVDYTSLPYDENTSQ